MSTEPEIRSCRPFNNVEQWYIGMGKNDSAQYLHRDGVWRRTTQVNGNYSGYYPTHAAAEAVLKQYG